MAQSSMGEGQWRRMLIPGEGIRDVFVAATDEEQNASSNGLMTYSAAAAALGHSRGWLGTQIEAGRIKVIDWMGRRWVDRDSVDGALRRLGRPDEDSQRLEQLQERGQGGSWEAQAILERMQRQADQQERAALGGPTVADLDRLNRDPIEQPDSAVVRPSLTETLLGKIGGQY